MSALKEFANFINLNLANLAETYAQLLAENDQDYSAFTQGSRVASGRKVFKAVIKACEEQTSSPVSTLFTDNQDNRSLRWAKDITPPNPIVEIECLGQTLTSVIPNLEAGKFLWQVLAETRAMVLPAIGSDSSPVSSASLDVSRDVSDRRDEAETLLQSEQRLSLHVQQTPMAYIEWDLDFQVTEWNPAAETIFGFTKNEAFGQHAAGLIVPADVKELVDQVWSDLLKQQGGSRSTNENITKDNRIITCEWYNTPLVDQDNEVIGVASLVQDISQRVILEQQLETLLEQRSKQVQASTEVAQEIATAPALDDLFRRVVNLVQERFGYYHAHVYTLEQDDLIMQEGTGEAGREMKKAGHKISLSAEQGLVARAARTGEPVLVPDVSQEDGWLPNPLLPETKSELAVPIILKSEVLGVLDIQNNTVAGLNQEDQIVMRGLCGQIAVAINNHRIEAARIRATEELKGSEEFLSNIINAIDDPVFVKDEEHRFVIVNDSFVNIVGRSRGALIGKNDYDHAPSEEVEAFWEQDELVLTTGTTHVNEEQATWRGETRIVSTKKSMFQDPITSNKYIVGIMIDITDRKETEDTVTQALTDAQILAEEQTVLNELGQALTARLNVEQILEETYRQTSRLVDTTNFYIGFYDEKKRQIAFTFDVTESEIDKTYTVISADEGLAGYMVRNKAGLLLEDNVKAQMEALGIEVVGEMAKSWLGVPMMVGDDVLGVIAVQSHTAPRQYDAHSQELLTAIANQAAIVIQNARQFEETQRRAQREQTIREITEKLRQSPNMETLVRVAGEEVGKVLGASQGRVKLEAGIAKDSANAQN